MFIFLNVIYIFIFIYMFATLIIQLLIYTVGIC